MEIKNPFTNKVVGHVEETSLDNIESILDKAHAAKYQESGSERAAILLRFADILESKKDECAKVITDESGLSLKHTKYEVERVANAARYAAQVASRIDDDQTHRYILDSKPGPKLSVISEPIDLVIGITPFNHPMNQVGHKVFPAIAAGASIVLKPTKKTPLSALKLRELLSEAGLPEDIFKIVINQNTQGLVRRLITHPKVDLVSFTGSHEVGFEIAQTMAVGGNALKKYVPELGGSSAFIVNDDADLACAAELAVKGCFGNSGQRCTAIRRIIVLDSVANEFTKRLVNLAKEIKHGDPYDTDIDMGTVIDESAAKLIESRVNSAISDGASLLLGNKRDGALYSPTILENVSASSELVTLETFGPVAPIIRVANIDEAISIAKNTDYALAGAIATKNGKLAERVANELVVGQFNWNGIPGYRTEAAPFGGFKHSGSGEKEGIICATEGMRRLRTFYEH
jgi:phosphonoacetaldehyde dehydrogenase